MAGQIPVVVVEPGVGPHKLRTKKNKIDANRSAVFRNGFEKKKQKHNQIFSNMFTLLDLEFFSGT